MSEHNNVCKPFLDESIKSVNTHVLFLYLQTESQERN
jgi:hypothetical protein